MDGSRSQGGAVEDRERYRSTLRDGQRRPDGHERRAAEVSTGAARENQHREYGGFNLGASFFGWLDAIGIAVLLTAFLSAAGAAIGFTTLDDAEFGPAADTIGLLGGILLILVLSVAYLAGGYVAGRMSRFDGGRQGLGVWVFGLVATIVLAILGAIAGSEYNLLAQLELPRIPVDEGTVTVGAVIVLVLIAIATLLSSVAGGRLGERYHHRVDRAGGRID